MGMNADPATDSGYSGIDHAMQLLTNGNACATENGTCHVSAPVKAKVWVAAGDDLEIWTAPQSAAGSADGLSDRR